MPAHRLTAVLAATLSVAALIAAAPAGAHHSASAAASLGLDPPQAGCKLSESSYRSKCRGSRVVRVTWSVGCAYPDPIVEVRFWTPRPGKSPIVMETEEGSAASGVTVKRFEAGTKVFATVRVYCDFEGDGDTIDAHRITAESAPTAEAFIPPRLVLVESVTNSFCGIVPTNRQARYGLQAGETSGFDFTLIFNEDSLLGTDARSRAGLRRTLLHARGAGLNGKAPARPWLPGATGPVPTQAGVRLVPRRGGKLRVWAVIGGAKTNVLTLRVLPRRCRF
jgi:hypothetical protein